MSSSDLNLVVLAVTALLLTGVVAVRVSTRIGLPSLLLYLAIGLVIGESGLGLRFEDVDLTMILGTVALAIILAEGGFTTRWSVTRPVAALAGVLATLGVAISVVVTSALAYLLLDVDVRTAILLGAVVSSTDAAAVFAVLRQLPIRPRLRAALEAESGFNDPPVIILVTVVTSDAWEEASAVAIGGLMLYQLVVGAAVGVLVAWAGQWMLSRSALPSAGLYPLATVATLFLAFALAGLAGASSLMAVYVAGMWLGNATLPHRNATAAFTEGLAWLAQIGLFIMLGLLASPGRLVDAVVPAVIVGGALLLVARPLSVLVCATPFRLPWREQAFMSWAGLRGAVPIVLATIPVGVGLPRADMIFDVVFLLVVVFTLVQGPTLPWAARRLGVGVPDSTREVDIDSAPLDEIDATLLQFTLPEGSRLAGVYVTELRLPGNAAITLVKRDGEIFVPDERTVLRARDHLLLAAANEVHELTERRLRAVSRAGRLAAWSGEHGDLVGRNEGVSPANRAGDRRPAPEPRRRRSPWTDPGSRTPRSSSASGTTVAARSS